MMSFEDSFKLEKLQYVHFFPLGWLVSFAPNEMLAYQILKRFSVFPCITFTVLSF